MREANERTTSWIKETYEVRCVHLTRCLRVTHAARAAASREGLWLEQDDASP